MTTWTKQQVLELLRSGTPLDWDMFLSVLPPSDFRLKVPRSAGEPSTLLLLSAVVVEFCAGRDPGWGAVLAEAAYERATEIRAANPASVVLPSTVFLLAENHVKSLSLLGRSQEVLEYADKYIDLYKSLHNTTFLTVQKAAALANLHRLDEADALLKNPALFDDPVNGIEALRQRKNLDQLIVEVGLLQPPPSPPEPLPAMERALEILLGSLQALPHTSEQKQVFELLSSSATLGSLDPTDAGQVADMARILDEVQSRSLTKDGDVSELTVERDIRNATLRFHNREPAKAEIEAALETLKTNLAWALAAGKNDLIQSAYWGLYLCHSRLRQPGEAADALWALELNLEAVRRGIADPMRRGGVFRLYPHLFKALCKMLWASGRYADLFRAIEISKGRVIAEKLNAEGEAFDETAVRASIDRLPALVRREQFHYLTYFADEDCMYASLLTNQGLHRAVKPILISQQEIREAEKDVDPRDWSLPSLSDPRRIGSDVSAIMSPLVAMLDELLDEGVLQQGDLLCYCPAVQAQNIPLHYLKLRGGSVIQSFRVARVQSAFHLELLLRSAPLRPTDYVAVVVPARQDQNRPGFAEKLEAPVRVLEQCGLRGVTLRGENASLEGVKATPLGGSVVHFSTHGHFPEEGTPFRDSFLLLAGDDGFSDRERDAQADRRNDFSPAAVLEGGLRFDGSHVSVMACVSGLAREGIGGDALGLDWALAQTGAASILSSHWPVSASAAAEFFQHFYSRWLEGKQARAEAFRATMLELLEANPGVQGIRRYGAFSLTGDFR